MGIRLSNAELITFLLLLILIMLVGWLWQEGRGDE